MTQVLFHDMIAASDRWEVDIENATRVTARISGDLQNYP